MNINSIDLNLLRVFHTLAQERSVTRTAARLDLSQPAVSNALKRLRRELGDELFVRGQGGMVPTPRGDALAGSVADVLERLDAALAGGPDVDPARVTEPITLSCSDAEIQLHGGPILRALDRAGCRAPVQFLPLNTGYRADVLWRNRLSLTLSTMLYAPDGLKQRKAYDEHLVCLLRADHPAAASMDFEAYLAAEHLLIAPLGGAPVGYLDTWLGKQGLVRTIRLVSHSFGAAHTLVRDTGLVATLPSRQAAFKPFGDALCAVPLPLDAPPFSVHLFWSERFDKDPLNKWLRDIVHTSLCESAGVPIQTAESV